VNEIGKSNVFEPQQAIFQAMLYGIRAWLVYWAIETGLITGARWLLHRHTVQPLDPSFVGLLLLVYLCAGIATGALSGVMIAALRPAAWQRYLAPMANLAVLLVFVIFTRQFLATWQAAALAFVGILFVIAAGSGAWGRRLSFFANPWVCGLLLIGSCLIQLSEGSPAWKALLFLGYALAAAIGGVAIARLTPSLPERAGLALSLTGAVAVCGVSCLLTPTPIISAPATAAAAASRPNLILIVMDTVRADHLSVYGYDRDTSPELRKFAQRATLYTHSYSAGDMTLISHASLFTGLYPIHHGAHYMTGAPLGRPLDNKYQTMAELLAAQGYDTLGIVANDGYVSQEYGLSQGFAVYDQRAPRTAARATPMYTLSGRIQEFAADHWPTAYFLRMERTAGEINRQTGEMLTQYTTSSRPFFLFLNYLDAHTPYVPAPPYDRVFPGKDPTLNRPRLDQMRWDMFTQHRPMSQAVYRHITSQYDGGIAYLDAQLGKLFSDLERRGVFDNSMIVVTSDHGEAFGKHDILNHGGMAVEQSQVFVPLLIKYPGQKEAQVVQSAVSGVDVLPTALETLRLPVPSGLDGHSLRQAGAEPDRAVLSASYPGGTASYINPQRFSRTYHAVTMWPFRLVRSSAGSPQMYDLSADPEEDRNIYDPQNPQAHQLDERLSAWLRSALPTDKNRSKIDAETQRRLKSLGYIGGQ
jgi:arylsulfatase A-like enzyme